MAEPDPRSLRRRISAGAFVLGVLAVILVVAVQRRHPAPPPPQPAAEAPKTALPAPLPTLGRHELLQAVAAAADAYAAGRPLPKSGLVGRDFELRFPFGCRGPAGASPLEPGGWTYDPAGRTLRVTARRQDWSGAGWIRALAAPRPVEAVEGFWIARPWTSAEACPAPPASAAPPPALPFSVSPPSVGLAEFFAPGGSRLARRRDKPYEFVRKLDGDAQPGPREFRLALSGRVAAFPDGHAIHCHADSPDERPVCLVAVDFEETALEDARTADVLASWR